MYVATIIAAPDKRNLSGEILQAVKDSLADVSKIKILREGVAADIYFEQVDFSYKGPQGFDFIIQKHEARQKKMLACDMESTIIANEFLDEIAELKGIKDQVAVITDKAMNGEISFTQALKERIALVKNIPESEIRALMPRLTYNPGAKELIAACKKAGIYTMLVTGGFTIFSDHVANELGFDEAHANRLNFNEHGFLEGIAEPILGRQAKLEITQKKAAELGIKMEEVAAVGDGANDIPLLNGVGLGIAYKAKPNIRAEIKNQINYSDLSGLAYALGIL